MLKVRLLAASALVAVSAFALADAAHAQAAAEQPASPEAPDAPDVPEAGEGTITVTGSRISTAGYNAPTPVTVIGEALLLRDARTSIGDSIRELPAVGSSASPNNGAGAGGIVAGTNGLDTVNLRQLGFLRTLTLFDGQRVVSSVITGQVDISTIPAMLVKRVDVVTAGASAAWGSDAVAGVVNLVLNKEFDGFRASFDYGDTYRFDKYTARYQAAVGGGFGGGRGRLIAAVNHQDSPQTLFAGQRDWNRYSGLMPNPLFTATNSEPRFVTRDFVGLSQATTGGLITSGPLRGTQFVGPNATPTPFNFGQIAGPISWGGDAEQLNASIDNRAVDFRGTTLFGFASYEFADWLKVSLQGNYGATHSRNNSVPVTRFGTLVIQRDNAFLPASIRQQMINLNIQTFNLGTTNLNNLSTGQQPTLDSMLGSTVAVPQATIDRTLKRGVLTFEGELGGSWHWNAYYQRGSVKVDQQVTANMIVANYNRSINAVVAPAGNVAGIAAGTIVCRDLLNADAAVRTAAAGCAPLNLFGTGVASQAAIDYINVRPGQNFQLQSLTQTVAAATINGQIAIGLPAGDISVAAGIERRTERGNNETDEGARNRRYALANFAPFSGRYSVTEGFLELDVPLLKDKFVDSLNLNGAVRLTDYSTSGSVVTWKVGLTSQLNSDLRLRGTISRDIRAPNLNELFSGGVATSGSAVDPNTRQNVPIFTFASGNLNLKPEVAQTYSFGAVLTPSFLPRFYLAVDYYNISISDAISSINSVQVLARCVNGDAPFCGQLVFGGPGGVLSQINTFPQNLAQLSVSGVDFQGDWKLPFLSGDLQLRMLGNYIIHQRQNQLGVIVNYAGALSQDNGVTGVPRARVTFSTTYEDGPLSVTAQTRFVGAAKLVYSWTDRDVDRNRVAPIAYVDLRASYSVTPSIQLFATVDNLLNQAPPVIPLTPDQGQSVYFFTAVRSDIHDQLGRYYRGGIRVNF